MCPFDSPARSRVLLLSSTIVTPGGNGLPYTWPRCRSVLRRGQDDESLRHRRGNRERIGGDAWRQVVDLDRDRPGEPVGAIDVDVPRGAAAGPDHRLVRVAAEGEIGPGVVGLEVVDV